VVLRCLRPQKAARMSEAYIAKIGRFQLENLLRNNVRFLYVDLRTSSEENQILKSSIRLAPEQVRVHLEGNNIAKDHPVVLICDDGKISLKIALELESNSFRNVFVVDGGYSAI
jgi:rhodanese-related sulfurtransferase